MSNPEWNTSIIVGYNGYGYGNGYGDGDG